MRRVDHDFVALGTTFGQFDQDTPEYPYIAPPDDAVVSYLVRLVTWRRIAPP